MRNHLPLALILGLALVAGALPAQAGPQPAEAPVTTPGQKPAPHRLIGPGVKHNFVSLEEVMREIHQLMFQGRFTPKQDSEVSRMMIRLGTILQEMGGPQGEKLSPKHDRELQQIRHRIAIIRQQLENRQ